jgi:hypothetical protein
MNEQMNVDNMISGVRVLATSYGRSEHLKSACYTGESKQDRRTGIIIFSIRYDSGQIVNLPIDQLYESNAMDQSDDDDDDEDNRVASKTSKKRVRTKTKSSKPDKKKTKKVNWKDEETIDESTGLLKLSSSEEANAALVGSEITVAAHGRGKIIAYFLRGGVFKGQFKCLFNGKVIFIDIDESDLQNSTPSCAAEDQFRYLSAEEGIVVVQHDRDADKIFLSQHLCDHLLSRGKEIDLDKEYPRLNRHVQKVVKKSLSEYLNVKDQDQLELYLRMKNVASLWANDILQQKIR